MSTLNAPLKINGVISTDKTVTQNINTLCTACGSWMTYDIAEGKWSVVINQAGSFGYTYARTAHSFTNTNASFDTSIKKIGSASAYFDGTANLRTATSTDYGFGTASWTIECWVYRGSATRTEGIIDLRTQQSQLAPYLQVVNASPRLLVNGSNVITGGNVLTANAWHHIAVVKNGTSTKMYVNGTQTGSTYTDNNTYVSTAPVTIGEAYSGAITAYNFLGRIDEVRISKGVARYTGTFTPSTTAFENDNFTTTLLHLNSDLTDDVGPGTFTGTAKSFTDNNIIGGINVSGKGINELYNSVSIEFPHKDLRDQTDYIDLDIATADRFTNELDNKLNMSIDCINDPVQAQYLATAELKQSRVDKVIQFRTDYTSLGLKAGELIDVTAEMYGYTNKVFRITKVEEADDDVLTVSITALEYSSDVYSTSGLIRKERTKKTGIIPKSANTALTNIDNQQSLKLMSTDSAQAQGLNLFWAAAASTWYLDVAGKQVQIAANDVVITWLYPDGEDLDIRCRLYSPDAGQNSVDDCLGYSGGDGSQFPSQSTRYWPAGGTGGSGGTAYLEWGGDNTGVGGTAASSESVRIDIDRIKAAYPAKRYIVVECRGNFYTARGSSAVTLKASLYEGGTTALSGFGFANTGATRTRILDSQGVYVDSFHGAEPGEDGYTGEEVIGDLMAYFVYDTQTNTGQFMQTLPPAVLT